MGWGMLNLSFINFWTFDASSNKKKFQLNQAPTSHVEGKIPRFPGTVSLQLNFIGIVGLAFWKLFLEDFYRYLRQQYAI